MSKKKLEINTALQIQKQVGDIFDAIIDPIKMSNYFISKSTGPMEEGKSIIWNFPEFEIDVPIRVDKIIKDKYISYYWHSDEVEVLVEISFEEKEDKSTLVTIKEKSRENNTEGINWLKNNTAGWANFLACLKAFLEHGINLRKGAFEFLRNT